MLGRFVAASRFVEQAPVDADHAVAADDPIVRSCPLAAKAFAAASSAAMAGASESPLDRVLVEIGLHGSKSTPGRLEHLPADRAGGSENQGHDDNLVEKDGAEPSAEMGTRSIGELVRQLAHRTFDDSSTGTESIPSL